LNALLKAAKEVSDFMAAQNWPHCLIGGLAVAVWGEPRTTLDADFTLLVGWGEEKTFADQLLDAFNARIADAGAFAESNRVLLLKASNGKDLDITFGALPFEEEMIRRAAPVEFAPGCMLPCCTAEDLFILKAFAGRPQDLLDAESIAVRQSAMNEDYILEHLKILCELKESQEPLMNARNLLEKAP